MGTFAQRVTSDDRIATDPESVYAVLTDPDLLARLTPLVAGITVDGDRWTWQLVGVNALGIHAAPEFTTIMDITEKRIAFRPAPDVNERAAARGHIDVVRAGTPDQMIVAIDLVATVALPLPKLTARGVEQVMFRTMKVGGSRFADNLLRHLGNPWHRGLEVKAQDPDGYTAAD